MSNLCGDVDDPRYHSDGGNDVKESISLQQRFFSKLFTCQDETGTKVEPIPSPAGVDQFDDGLSYGDSKSFGDDISYESDVSGKVPMASENAEDKRSPGRDGEEKLGISLDVVAPTFDSNQAVIHRSKQVLEQKNQEKIPLDAKSVLSNIAVKDGLSDNRKRMDLRDKIVETITTQNKRNNLPLPPSRANKGKKQRNTETKQSLPYQVQRVDTMNTDVAVRQNSRANQTHQKASQADHSVTGTECAVKEAKGDMHPDSRRIDAKEAVVTSKHRGMAPSKDCNAGTKRMSRYSSKPLERDGFPEKKASQKDSQPTMLVQADTFATEHAISGHSNETSAPPIQQKSGNPICNHKTEDESHLKQPRDETNSNMNHEGGLLSSVLGIFIVKKPPPTPESQLEDCVMDAHIQSHRKLTELENGKDETTTTGTNIAKEKTAKFIKKNTEMFPFGRMPTLASIISAIIAMVLTAACRSSTNYATLKTPISLGSPYTYVPEIGIFYMEVCLKDQIISTFKNHEGMSYETVLQIDYDESTVDTHWYPNSVSQMVDHWEIVDRQVDSSTTEMGETTLEEEEFDDQNKICSKVHLRSYMVNDLWWNLVRISVGMTFFTGIIFTSLLSLSIFWSSINLNPILFGLFFTYLGQSSAFFFFDCDMCKTYGCEHSTGTDLAIASAVFWFLASFGCLTMKFHYRAKKQIEATARRDRMDKIISNQRSLVFKYFRSGNRRDSDDRTDCSTNASVEEQV